MVNFMRTSNSSDKQQQQKIQRHKVLLGYDIAMMVLILVNLFCLASDGILTSDFALWFANLVNLTSWLNEYITHLHPWVEETEHWFTLLLIVELFIHWAIAIYHKTYPRWFFFPFVHWYEVLAIIPQLRFLRLFRAGVIAYRLHQLDSPIIPKSIYYKAEFYYFLILEELTRRIVLTVILGVERELQQNGALRTIIHDMLDQHRQLFAETLSELLQKSLATALHEQQRLMSVNVGKIVNQAIENTPELHQMLRLFPVIGGRLEQQIQSIGQRLGENITQGLIEPFVEKSDDIANQTYQLIAQKTSETNLNTDKLNQLVQSVIFESLEIVRKQLKMKKWQEMLHPKPEDVHTLPKHHPLHQQNQS